MYHHNRNAKYAGPSMFSLLGHRGALGMATPCFEDDPPPPKTFTQAEVDAFNAKTRRETEAKFEGFDAFKEKADKVDALEADLQKLKDEALLKDKSIEEREKILADRAREQSEAKVAGLEKQVLDVTALAEKAGATLLAERMHTNVGGALTKAGVLPTATGHALTAFLSDTDIKLNDKGKIESVSLGGVPQKDVAAAAAQFLTDNPHFKAAAAGGGGATTPNSGTVTPDQMKDMSCSELAAHGWKTPPTDAASKDPFDKTTG